MVRNAFLLAVFLGLLTPYQAMAQKAEPPKDSVVAAKKQSTPIETWVAAENAMIDPLSTKNKESVFILRNKYSVIRAIDVVERDVGAAVTACGKANPDLKGTMNGRFDQWKNAVHPIIKTAKKNLDDEISTQKLVDPAQFKKVLKLNDAAFDYSDKRTVKTPVSSPEACQNLLASMDRTEDEMISLLQKSLLPESVIRSRAEKMSKDQAKKSAIPKKE